MGKMKIGIYCYFIGDIWTAVFLEMFVGWSSTKHHGNQKAKFAKNIKKSTPLRSYVGDKADIFQKCS